MKKRVYVICLIIVILIIIPIIYIYQNNSDEDSQHREYIELDEEKTLFINDRITSFSISQDEKYIVYSNFDDEFWIYNIETDENNYVYTAESGFHSPFFNKDATKIIFQEQNNVIQIDIDGKNKNNFTFDNGQNPKFLRDYSKIIYERSERKIVTDSWSQDKISVDCKNIWIMDSDGNNKNQLTYFDYPYYPTISDISPDNTKILLTIWEYGHPIERRSSSNGSNEDQHGIWEIGVDGSNLRRLIDGEKDAIEYSSDGLTIAFYSRIYYHKQPYFLMDLNGNNVRFLNIDEDSEITTFIKFLPNNNDVLCFEFSSYDNKKYYYDYWIMDFNCENIRYINLKDPELYLGVYFFNDGDSLGYVSYNEGFDENEFHIIKFESHIE
jgi:hypothetical protein